MNLLHLKPGGINIYTVRHINDGDYMKGIHRGEEMYENDGFIINFFSKKKVNSLLKELLDLPELNLKKEKKSKAFFNTK